MLRSLPVVVLVLFIVFAGCESNNSFMTKAGIESKIGGKWSMVKIPVSELGQLWEFNSGVLTITRYDSLGTTVTARETGSYEIVAKIATPYFVIKGDLTSYAIGRWVIINIDDKHLTVNRQSDNTFGTLQREFVKLP